MPMSAKEVEAGLSLLHMMQPPSPEARQEEELGVHASLLRVVASQADALALACVTGGSGDSDGDAAHKRTGQLQLSTVLRDMGLEELRAHFNKPIVEVAKEFGICTTFLKKICRRSGIKRWPHRQIRSLSRTIQMLQVEAANAATPQERTKAAVQIAQLEAKKRAVIENPDATGKLKRVKKCGGGGGAKQRGSSGAARGGGKSSSTGSGSGGDVDMEACDEDLDDDEDAGDALRLQLTGGGQPQSATPEIALGSLIGILTPLVELPVVGERAAAASAAFASPLSAKTVTSSALSAPRVASAASMGPDSADSEGASHRMSPSNRKLLLAPNKLCDAEKRLRSSSMGSLQDENEQPPRAAMLEVSI